MIPVQVLFRRRERSNMAQNYDLNRSELERAFQLRQEGSYVESAAIFLRFAELGDGYAQLQLGDMLDRGLGVVRDASGARKWLALAASSGEDFSKLRFARFLERERQYPEAFQIVHDLAATGYSPAIYRLSKYYEEGLGTERDSAKANFKLQEAAKRGHARALRSVAILELSGRKGLWRVPVGLFRIIWLLFYVSRLTIHQPDSPNLQN